MGNDSKTKLISPEFSSPDSTQYKVYPYRFVVYILTCLSSMQNFMMWSVVYPLQSTNSDIYDLNLAWIVFGTSSIQNITYLPGTFLANYFYDQIGIRAGTFVGGVLTLAGLWVRSLCGTADGFWYIMAGHTLGGIGQPFFFNIPQKISSTWFSPKERTYATTGMTIFFSMANSIGSLIPQFFLKDDQSKEEKITQIQKMFLFTAILGTISYIPGFLFIRSKPDTPPSAAQEESEKANKDFKQNLKNLWNNKNATIFIIACAFNQSATISFSYILEPLLQAFDFNYEDASNIFSLANFLQIPGAFLGAIVVSKTSKYKLPVIGLSFLGVALILGVMMTAATGLRWLLMTYYCICYFFQGPIVPLTLEFVVELAFPVGEATSGGLIVMLYEIISCPITILTSNYLNHPNKTSATVCFFILAGVCAIGAFMMFFVKEDLRRQKFEKAQAHQDDSILDKSKSETVKAEELGSDYTSI